jgi:hypothetical protein
MNKSSAFCSSPRTLATDAEDELAHYDAMIAETRTQLNALAAGGSTPASRRIRSRAAHVLAGLERGRDIAAAAAGQVWDATLAAHGVVHAGGAA